MAASCSTVKFYSQAVAGQWEIISKKTPVEKLVSDPNTPEALRQRLVFTQQVRAFAKDHLQLPSDAYDAYTDLKRKHVTWVVFAAPELSLQPKQWQYPIVGKLSYRGFFKEADARKLVEELKKEKYDIAMGGVDAYSTLGYFNDPLLNTFIFDPEVELAELLFHELTHREVFLPGDTDFNEAFATAVAEEGVKRWLTSQGKTAELRKYQLQQQQSGTLVAAILETRKKLDAVFKSEISDAEKRRAKVTAYKSLSQKIHSLNQIAGQKSFQSWVTKPINNARINTVSTYRSLVPGFHRLLATCGGDLPKFYRTVADMKSLSKDERRAKLR